MTTIKTIPSERLRDLDVHEGDTLHILASEEASFLIEIVRKDPASTPAPGKASEWLRSAKGIVRHASGKSMDDLRMDYYTSKYGLSQ